MDYLLQNHPYNLNKRQLTRAYISWKNMEILSGRYINLTCSSLLSISFLLCSIIRSVSRGLENACRNEPDDDMTILFFVGEETFCRMERPVTYNRVIVNDRYEIYFCSR